jgi:hypothetical protein
LQLKCDEPLSNVAFNFNLRRYTAGGLMVAITVRRCKSTASNPELKACLVSALETTM